ncbi:MAG TPA: hypothetical protein VLT33_11275 [Labilithrix sp.]|nr:hypothetical protein [Labilithrix sp.]
MTASRVRSVMLAGSLVGLSLLAPAVARAGTKECIAAADDGQKLRDEGKLTAARDKFIACSAKACPGAVAKQCSAWLVDAEKDMPSITFRALDEQGKETLEVKVSVDGVQVAAAIEARAVPADPGEHTVKFERADGTAIEDRVMLRPGEKNRIIELSFQPKAPPPGSVVAPVGPVKEAPAPDPGGLKVPLLAWIGLGVGVAGGVMTAVFAVSANSDETHLRETCAPKCDPADRSSIETKVVFANVALGLGIAGLGVAVVSTILANGGSSKPKPASRLGFDVSPGSLLVRGAF